LISSRIDSNCPRVAEESSDSFGARQERKQMKYFLMIALFLSCAHAQTYQSSWDSLDKRPTPQWYTESKFGIFIHWGVYSVPAYAPVIPGKLAYSEWYWKQMVEGRDNPKANEIETGTWAFHKKNYGADYPYQNFAPQFRAELFDAQHWADVLASSGAKYVVLTSKHHDGFALWPSMEASADWGRPWNAAEIGPQRNLMSELSEAVRSKGLHMGYYYSLYEWFNPLWLRDKSLYTREHMIPQFKDLVTHYRPDIIFGDGEWEQTSADWHSPELLAWLFNESPVKDVVVINDRWGSDTRHKHGGYWTTEYTPGMSDNSHSWEENRGIGFSFGFNRAEQLKDYHTGRELVIMLVDTVSRGGNLLLDIGPSADGTIPVLMEERLREIGSWLKINGDAVYGTKPWKSTRQWSAGKVPDADYSRNMDSEYDISKLVSKPEPGKAGIEAFFTTKGSDLFVILPRWSNGILTLRDVEQAKSVTLLGSTDTLKFKSVGKDLLIQLPDLPEDLRQQAAWVLKISR
jgi:alpha-L-fucosidase